MLPGNHVISEPTLRERNAAPRRDQEAILTRYSEWLAALVVAIGFCWRLWLAHATFFNPDEAWHYSLADQRSLYLAYEASLTIPHPPLLVLVLYFWRSLGTSNLVLRLPVVIAGTLFCWFSWKWLTALMGRTVGWVGLILVTFLPSMIAVSADLRQYPLMLLFTVSAAYFLERSLAGNSAPRMMASMVCLYLAILSTYSAFFFAAALGGYCIFRMYSKPPSLQVISVWGIGEAGSLGLAWFLYRTHIAKIGSLQVSWLSDYYFHPGRDHILPFLLRGTFGFFRFVFSWAIIGYLAPVLFATGVILLVRQKSAAARPPSCLVGLLLLLPFVLNWAAVAAGLYPYGRARQCIFLAIFGIAGVSLSLARIARGKMGPALALAAGIVVLCQVFGTQPGRDMLPLAEQRHEHMDQALAFLQREVSPEDVIYLNKSTEFQLAHYLCDQKQVVLDRSVAGFESFQCRGLRVISTFPNDDAVQLETFPFKWREMARAYGLNAGSKVWVFQGGWTRGFAESLRARFRELAGIEAHPFGQYLEVFHVTVEETPSSAAAQL